MHAACSRAVVTYARQSIRPGTPFQPPEAVCKRLTLDLRTSIKSSMLTSYFCLLLLTPLLASTFVCSQADDNHNSTNTSSTVSYSPVFSFQLTEANDTETSASLIREDDNPLYLGNHTHLVKSQTQSSTNDPSFLSSHNVRFIWWLVFGSMIVIGILANLLVVATIGGHKSLHTPTNCFLLNLTLSDLVTLVFNATFNFVFMLNEHWPFGALYCVVNNFIANLTVAVSVFTIMFTSKERYNAIVHPLRKRMTKKRAIIHIVIIWLAGVLFAMPTLIFSRIVNRFPVDVQASQKQQQSFCLLKWPDGFPGQSRFDFIYNLVFLVLTYLLPLMTMAIAYTLMARVLWGSQQIGESTQAQMKLISSKQKVVRMLICVVVVFGVCWLPYHAYFLVTYQWPGVTNNDATKHIYLAIYWMAMSNSMLNPIILLFMNKRFRRYSVKLLNCWPLNRILCCIMNAQQMLPSETLHTAIVQAHGANHQETTTMLVGHEKKIAIKLSLVLSSDGNNNAGDVNHSRRKSTAA